MADYDEGQVAAMVSLLSDDSESVVESCHRALLEAPELAEAALRDRLEGLDAEQGGERSAVQRVLVDIVGGRFEQDVVAALSGSCDLEQGSILIGRLVDPGDGPDKVRGSLDALADQVLAEIGVSTDPDTQLAAMVEVLVERQGIHGIEAAHRPSIKDATVPGALERRRGLPLPLCLIWILVGRRAGIPIQGLNMPNHFLLRHVRDQDTSPILDAFHKGKSVSTADCHQFLSRAGYASTDLEPLAASDRDMLKRTLRNLRMIAMRASNPMLRARCERILAEVG